ncbi:hypothetical protein EV1_024178 [Malus domestica]
MLDAGVRPTRKAYNILLHAFAISGMGEQARTVFKSMRRDRWHNVKYRMSKTVVHLHIIKDMPLLEGRNSPIPKNLLSDLDSEPSVFLCFFFWFNPDLCSYTTMLSAYVNASEMEGAEKFFIRIIQDAFKPNAVTYGTLIKGDFGSAVVWYQEMESCRLPPDQKAKNILLSLVKTAEEQKVASQLVGNLD